MAKPQATRKRVRSKSSDTSSKRILAAHANHVEKKKKSTKQQVERRQSCVSRISSKKKTLTRSHQLHGTARRHRTPQVGNPTTLRAGQIMDLTMTDVDESASDAYDSEDTLTTGNRVRLEPVRAPERLPLPRDPSSRAPRSLSVIEKHKESHSASELPQASARSGVDISYETNQWYIAHSTAITAAIRTDDPFENFPGLSKHDIAAWSQRLRRMHTGPQLGRVILPEPANGKSLTEAELEEAVYAFMESLTKEDLLILHEETDFLLTVLRWHFTLPDRKNTNVPYPQTAARRFNIPHYNIGINIMPGEHANGTLFLWRLTLLGSWVQEVANKSTWFIWSTVVEEGWEILVPAGMPQFGEQDLEAGPSAERRGVSDMPFGYPRTGRESVEYGTGYVEDGGPLEMRWDFQDSQS